MSLNSFFSKIFPTPNFLELSHVGIEILPDVVRFIEIKKTSTHLKVGKYDEVKMINPIDFNQPLSDHGELVNSLTSLRKKHKLKYVVASIPEEKTYLFSTEVLKGNDKAIKTAIEFNLEENVPLSLDEAIFEYSIINSSDKNGKVSVAVSVVSEQVVNNFTDLYLKCGLIPVSFLTEPQAIKKSVVKNNDTGTYLLVRLGATKTNFAIISENAVQFASTLGIGGNDFTKAIMKQFSVDKNEAEQIKKDRGFLKNSENNNLFTLLMNVSSALHDEIERIYGYWHSRRVADSPFLYPEISKIILCGKESSLIGFKEYLALSIKTEVELANVWSNIFSFEDYVPPIEKTDSLDYAAVVGLASSNFDKK